MRITVFAISCTVACAMCGCTVGRGDGIAVAEPDYSQLGPVVSVYLPAIEADSVEGWGMVRPDGDMLFSDRFADKPSVAVNGFFSVRDGGGVSVYRASDNPELVAGLDGLVHAGAMSHGFIPVTRKGGRIELVNGDGVVKMELTSISGKEIVKSSPFIRDGVLAVCTQDSLWGAVNINGEMILEPVYDNEPLFNEGIAWVARSETEPADSFSMTRNATTEYALVNNRGRMIFRFPRGVKPVGCMQGGAMVIELASGQLAMLAAGGDVIELPRAVKRVCDHNTDVYVWSDGLGNRAVSDRQSGHQSVTLRRCGIELADSGRMLISTPDGVSSISDSVGRAIVRFSGFDKVSFIGRPETGVASPFRFIGDGYAGKVLMDYAGRRLGKGPLKDLDHTRLTLLDDGYVHTDYFNVQAAIHAVLSKMTDNGWGRASLRQPMCELVDSVRGDNVSESMLCYEKDSPYLVNLSALAFSSRPLGRDSIAAEGGARVFFADTTSRVEYLKVEAATSGRRFTEMVRSAGDELVGRGFRAEKLRDEYAVYLGREMVVVMTPRPKLAGADFYLMDREFYMRNAERILSDAERIFKNG